MSKNVRESQWYWCQFVLHGETDDAFLIGGLVGHAETLTTCVIRHCKRLVGFSPGPNQRLYLTKGN